MADPAAAVLTQLRNIQSRTGRTIAALHAELAATGLAKVGEKRSWLMEHHALGYGDANTVALLVGKLPPGLQEGAAAASKSAPTPAPAAAGDPLDAIYVGSKAHLRPLHEAVMAVVQGFGPFEVAPKKGYLSLRRSKQFAMLGPATKEQIEIGFNAKDLPAHARLKPQPAGSMCQATTRISSAAEVDAPLAAWLRRSYDAAG